jgi:hypothetical protein
MSADLALSARVDVADMASEQEVDFRWWEGETMIGHVTDLQQLPYNPGTPLPSPQVLDGGRLLTGGVSFTVETTPGRPLTLLARTHNVQPNGFEVFVDGVFVDVWRHPTRPGEWVETSFIIGGGYVTGEESRIRLVVTNRDHYVGLYHLWIFDGAPTFAAYEGETPLQAQFAHHLELKGFTVNEEASAVEVDLIWRKFAAGRIDAKVFVHLYAPSGALAAQHDGYPAFGTRPPYSWHEGEQIVDGRRLSLPPDLAPGAYELMVGLYEPDTGERVPITADGDRERPDDRLWLTTIDMK